MPREISPSLGLDFPAGGIVPPCGDSLSGLGSKSFRHVQPLPESCKTISIGVVRDVNYLDDVISESFKMSEESVEFDSDTTGQSTVSTTIDAILRHEGMYVRWDSANDRCGRPLSASINELTDAILGLKTFIDGV